MKKLLTLSVLTLAFLASAPTWAEDGFKPLFNGTDLKGWDGNPELWSVEDGSIVGKTTGPEQLDYNQFLIYRGAKLENFELRAKIKQVGNNTGIQYRSQELSDVGAWSIGGYQCDIHPTPANNAMVYGEKAGGILVQNGQTVVIGPDGRRWLVAQQEPVSVDVAEWHEYTVIARGNHIIHKVDGQTTVDLTDFDEATRSHSGLLAFQIHRGPSMTVHIKDVMLKELPPGGFTAFDKGMLPAGAKPIESGKPPAKPRPKKASK